MTLSDRFHQNFAFVSDFLRRLQAVAPEQEAKDFAWMLEVLEKQCHSQSSLKKGEGVFMEPNSELR